MTKIKTLFFVSLFAICAISVTKAQDKKTSNEINQKGINKINSGMPNRISMNVTVPKQTQGASFGEKVNSRLNITLIENGCIILFPSNEGYKINLTDNSINDLSKDEGLYFGEKINAGVHAAGSAISQGGSLLGGALPGGAIISAAVSSVSHLSGHGSGAASASYAKNSKTNYPIDDSSTDATLELPDGEFELIFVIKQTASSKLKEALKTQVTIGFSVENGLLKTKHDTVKNSISNIR